VCVLVSMPAVTQPAKLAPARQSSTSSSIASQQPRDELMDVGLEFVTNANTSSKPSSSYYPPDVDSSQPASDTTSAHQVFTL